MSEKIPEELTQNKQQNNIQKQTKGDTPLFTGTVDLGILGKRHIALWPNDNTGENQPALIGSFRRKEDGKYVSVGRIALWNNKQ